MPSASSASVAEPGSGSGAFCTACRCSTSATTDERIRSSSAAPERLLLTMRACRLASPVITSISSCRSSISISPSLTQSHTIRSRVCSSVRSKEG